MKLRWSSKQFKCECGKQVRIGELSYICKCCSTKICKTCGERKAS